jgi:hypothetical protein
MLFSEINLMLLCFVFYKIVFCFVSLMLPGDHGRTINIRSVSLKYTVYIVFKNFKRLKVNGLQRILFHECNINLHI